MTTLPFNHSQTMDLGDHEIKYAKTWFEEAETEAVRSFLFEQQYLGEGWSPSIGLSAMGDWLRYDFMGEREEDLGGSNPPPEARDLVKRAQVAMRVASDASFRALQLEGQLLPNLGKVQATADRMKSELREKSPNDAVIAKKNQMIQEWQDRESQKLRDCVNMAAKAQLTHQLVAAANVLTMVKTLFWKVGLVWSTPMRERLCNWEELDGTELNAQRIQKMGPMDSCRDLGPFPASQPRSPGLHARVLTAASPQHAHVPLASDLEDAAVAKAPVLCVGLEAAASAKASSSQQAPTPETPVQAELLTSKAPLLTQHVPQGTTQEPSLSDQHPVPVPAQTLPEKPTAALLSECPAMEVANPLPHQAQVQPAGLPTQSKKIQAWEVVAMAKAPAGGIS